MVCLSKVAFLWLVLTLACNADDEVDGWFCGYKVGETSCSDRFAFAVDNLFADRGSCALVEIGSNSFSYICSPIPNIPFKERIFSEKFFDQEAIAVPRNPRQGPGSLWYSVTRNCIQEFQCATACPPPNLGGVARCKAGNLISTSAMVFSVEAAGPCP